MPGLLDIHASRFHISHEFEQHWYVEMYSYMRVCIFSAPVYPGHYVYALLARTYWGLYNISGVWNVSVEFPVSSCVYQEP